MKIGAAMHPTYQFGLVNNLGVLTSRYSLYGNLIAFGRPLTDPEMDKLMAMLGAVTP